MTGFFIILLDYKYNKARPQIKAAQKTGLTKNFLFTLDKNILNKSQKSKKEIKNRNEKMILLNIPSETLIDFTHNTMLTIINHKYAKIQSAACFCLPFKYKYL
ncbi:MAG: hypothetical protein A2V73_07170 [candidate division Zixibacteria bacterium RBG_19FT_COMBO_42_43]|nr:MAG: hypothetical protein A2V73_07170 [candidate division Zixibacteria bacterium RBG_19FT_COMBO_42_43]